MEAWPNVAKDIRALFPLYWWKREPIELTATQFCEAEGFIEEKPHSIHWTKIMKVDRRPCSFNLIEVWANAITSFEMHKHMGRYQHMDAMGMCINIYMSCPSKPPSLPATHTYYPEPILYRLTAAKDALILVYSVTSRRSLASLREVHSIIFASSLENLHIPITILANKIDVPRDDWEVSLAEGVAFTQEIGASAFESVTNFQAPDRVAHYMRNAVAEPAVWRGVAGREIEEEKEKRLADARQRIAEMGLKAGRRKKMKKSRRTERKRRKHGGTRMRSTGLSVTFRASLLGSIWGWVFGPKRRARTRMGKGWVSVSGGDDEEGVEIVMEGEGEDRNWRRLPIKAPTVDVTWKEWIDGITW